MQYLIHTVPLYSTVTVGGIYDYCCVMQYLIHTVPLYCTVMVCGNNDCCCAMQYLNETVPLYSTVTVCGTTAPSSSSRAHSPRRSDKCTARLRPTLAAPPRLPRAPSVYFGRGLRLYLARSSPKPITAVACILAVPPTPISAVACVLAVPLMPTYGRDLLLYFAVPPMPSSAVACANATVDHLSRIWLWLTLHSHNTSTLYFSPSFFFFRSTTAAALALCAMLRVLPKPTHHP